MGEEDTTHAMGSTSNNVHINGESKAKPDLAPEKATTSTEQPSMDDGMLDKDSASLRHIEERFAETEANMDMINDVLGFHEMRKGTAGKRPTSSILPISDVCIAGVPINRLKPDELETYHMLHRDFLFDGVFFMRRVRQSYQALEALDEAIAAKDKTKAQDKLARYDDGDLKLARRLSTEAFSKGQRAKAVLVDWKVFLASKEKLSETILTPIEVVSTEPEPQMILQLPKRDSGKTKVKLSDSRTIESDLWSAEGNEVRGNQPLPERIKIHSRSLLKVFAHISDSTNWDPAEDGSIVLLRPFRFLVYYEKQLRDTLVSLENGFKDADEKDDVIAQHSPSPVEEKPSSSSEKEQELVSSEKGGDCQADQGETTAQGKENEDEADFFPFEKLFHLRCLIDFFDNSIKPRIEHIRSAECTRILFHDLWHLFKPGDKVMDQTKKQAYLVLRVQIPSHKVEDPWLRWHRLTNEDDDDDTEDEDEVNLHCVYIDFDGRQFGPVSKSFQIPEFAGLKDIRSLPVVPIRYAQNAETHQDLIKRGRMLLDVAKSKPMYYMGYTLDARYEIDSQVVVDFNEALADEQRREEWEPTIGPVSTGSSNEIGKNCLAACCFDQVVYERVQDDNMLTEEFVKSLIPNFGLRTLSLILSPRPLDDILGNEGEITEDEFLIMTYRVFGFVLRSRKWAQLDLTFLRYENEDARTLSVNAFEQLELPSGHREMVRSLVIQHFRSKQSSSNKDEQTDLIKGKGKGLIILLHGAPGVGKTTTAEGIADLFKKPLFQITCGDLGTTAKEVEAELERNFALASRWGCILLLDEADIFLASRERMDFKRNGLVAVFLRVLEYYTGILFLTTNRVGDFDEAFASRIHMSLYYPPLDEMKTLKIFQLNLNLIKARFKDQGREVLFDPSSVEDFAGNHYQQHKHGRLNGRQIRNLCQTALALAEFDTHGGDIDKIIDSSEPVQLGLKHFKVVQQAYLKFGEYLGDIRGTKGDRRAIDLKWRARTDTPYEIGPSRFDSKAEEMTAHASQDGRHHMASMSSSNHPHHPYPSQEGSFRAVNQGHVASSPDTNVPSQMYQRYPQQQSQYVGKSEEYVNTMGYNISPRPMQSGINQQYDQRLGQQQLGNQYMPYQEVPRQMGANFHVPPSSQQEFQSQQQPDQRYGNPQQSVGSQAASDSMLDSLAQPMQVPGVTAGISVGPGQTSLHDSNISRM